MSGSSDEHEGNTVTTNTENIQDELQEENAPPKGSKWLQLKREIMKHQAMREAIIKEMESQRDPVFRRFLKIYKSALEPADFESNRLKIYALCNKHAMYNCLSVDEMVNVVVFGQPLRFGRSSNRRPRTLAYHEAHLSRQFERSFDYLDRHESTD